MAEKDEYEELQKFLAILGQKTAALILDARSGTKCAVRCNPVPTNADWFGLAVHESPEVRAQWKELTKDHIPVVDKAFGVEIIAQLPTMEEVPVEYWWLSFDPDPKGRDSSVRVKYVVYNRMAILLKSIVVVLRASPVNRLVRQSEYFKFIPKMFVGKPDTWRLQNVAQKFDIGPLKTPYGALYFYGACRETALSEGADYPSTQPVPRGIPLERPRTQSTDSAASVVHEKEEFPPLGSSPRRDGRVRGDPGSPRGIRFAGKNDIIHVGQKDKTFEELQCTGAFACASKSPSDSDDEDGYDIPDRAFASLVPLVDDDEKASWDVPVVTKAEPKSILKDGSGKSRYESALLNKPTDFMVKPSELSLLSCLSLVDDGFEEDELLDTELLRPAFVASKNEKGSHDLATFYHDCQVAPNNLKSLENKGVSVARTVKSLTQSLVGMETQLHEFDQFVDDLRQIGDESSWVMAMSTH